MTETERNELDAAYDRIEQLYKHIEYLNNELKKVRQTK